MDSSKTTILGIALIFVVFIGWLILMNQQAAKVQKVKPVATDTTRTQRTEEAQKQVDTAKPSATTDTAQRSTVFSTAHTASAVTKTVQTPLFTAQISSNGAAISSFILTEYKTWDGRPVDLVNHSDYHGADINLKFVASDGKTVATNDLPFTFDAKTLAIGAND